jgi:hypothetical protein
MQLNNKQRAIQFNLVRCSSFADNRMQKLLVYSNASKRLHSQTSSQPAGRVSGYAK